MTQVHHGPTTWKCLCGKTKVMEAFVLPLGWTKMEVDLGTGDIVTKHQSRILCDVCGPRFLFGGQHAIKQLPGPAKQLPSPKIVIRERQTYPDSISAKKKSGGTGRFRR